VVLTKATFDLAAGKLGDVHFERLGYRSLRNVSEPVALLRASREGAAPAGVIVDPVCRMVIADQEWIGTLCFEGQEFHFCSMECAHRFAADPARYFAASVAQLGGA